MRAFRRWPRWRWPRRHCYRAAPGVATLLACRASFPEAYAKEDTGARAAPPASQASPMVDDGIPLSQRGVHVYVWGQRWAMPVSEASGDAAPENDVRTPMEVHWFRLHAERHHCKWRQIAFGPSFGVARTDVGDLFLWGSSHGKGARLFLEPRPLLYDDGAADVRFVDVQCSESAVWALSTTGEVIVWERVPEMVLESLVPGRGRSGRLRNGRLLGGLPQPVRRMSVGPSHAAFVTEDGELHCIGSNRFGECAADPQNFATSPTCRRVKFPPGVSTVSQVACGRAHTVAVGEFLEVRVPFAWGDDSKIQLGFGDTRSNLGDERPWSGSRGYQNFLSTGEAMAPAPILRGGPEGVGFSKATNRAVGKYGEFEPHHRWRPAPMMAIPLEYERQVHGIPYPPPESIACGDDFTLLVVEDSPDWYAPEERTNRLFCCGDNQKGQCGRSMQTGEQTLAAVRLPRHSRTEAYSCGAHHCVAVLKRVGKGSKKLELWTWGNNEKGQAGGGKGVVCPAARLRVPGEVRIEAAWCGFNTSAVICSERESAANSDKKLRRQPSVSLSSDEMQE